MKSSKSLYDISEELLSIINQLQEESDETGEISAESEELLVISQGELAAKAGGYRAIMAQKDAEVAMIDEEIARLQKWKSQNEAINKRLEANLLQAVLLFGEEDKKGIKRLEVGLSRLSTRRSKSINIIDEALVPDNHKTIEIKFSAEAQNIEAVRKQLINAGIITYKEGKAVAGKTSIKNVIEAGKEVPGAEQITKYALTIK